MIKNLLLAFIPIFVAVDAVGVLPIFVSLTQGLKKEEKSRIIFQNYLSVNAHSYMLSGGFYIFRQNCI